MSASVPWDDAMRPARRAARKPASESSTPQTTVSKISLMPSCWLAPAPQPSVAVPNPSAEKPQLPGLRAQPLLRPGNPDAGVHRDAAVGPRQAEDQVGKRVRVGGGGAAEAGDKATRLPAGHELGGIGVGERCDPERRLADQLGKDAPRTKRDQRTEHRIL